MCFISPHKKVNLFSLAELLNERNCVFIGPNKKGNVFSLVEDINPSLVSSSEKVFAALASLYASGPQKLESYEVKNIFAERLMIVNPTKPGFRSLHKSWNLMRLKTSLLKD